MEEVFQNNAEGATKEHEIERGFLMLVHQNESTEVHYINRQPGRSYIQLHFGLKGSSRFLFNEGRYILEVPEEKMLLLYNPQKDLPIHLEIQPKSWLVSILITLPKFHGLFSTEAGHVDFLSMENKDKKYYTDGAISPSMAVVLHQLVNTQLHPSIRDLYMKGKMYELLSLYFNKSEETDVEQCPFLIDEEHILKIRKAKDIVLANMAEPSGLLELVNEVGLNLKKLKVGFKQLYGDTVYSFLFDYKMEYARKMLESGEFNVNEVSVKVGYSTPSHFIAGFKKKYGTTPKKYLMTIS